MTASENLLIVFTGPSGSGKTTLAKFLKSQGFRTTVSYTTRPLRRNEVDGVDYRQISMKDFLSARTAGLFAEWAEVHGNHYGTSAVELRDQMSLGDTVLDLDCQGSMNIKKLCPHAILIFVAPPSKAELQRRLESRGMDSREIIDRRIRNATAEIMQIEKFDAFILNADLEAAKAELLNLIQDVRKNGRNSLIKYHNPLKAQMTMSAWRS